MSPRSQAFTLVVLFAGIGAALYTFTDAIAKLKSAGADRVISPYEIGAVQIAQTALRPAVVDFVELATSSDNLDLAMEQVTISTSSRLASQTILDATLRQRLVENGRRRIVEKFNWRKAAEETVAVYEEVVARRAPRGVQVDAVAAGR